VSDGPAPTQGTRVTIHTPCPLDVYGTVLRVIGETYPESVVTSRYGTGVIVIPDDARPQPVTDADAEPASPFSLLALDEGGITVGFPELALHMLTEPVRALLDEHPEADNYVEFAVEDPDGAHRYAVLICRSARQTPHELRTRAEARAREAEARAHDAETRARAADERARTAEDDARALREDLRALTLAVGRAAVLDDARALDALRALAIEHLGPQRAPEPTTTARAPRAEGEPS